MDPKSFYKLLENPEKISSKDLNELSDILVNHPYFSSAHLLFALGHLERKSPGYEKKIEEHTIFLKNKKSLLNHFYNQSPPKAEESSKIEVIENTASQSENQSKSNSEIKEETKAGSFTTKADSEIKKVPEKKEETPLEKYSTEKNQKETPKATVKTPPQVKPSEDIAKKDPPTGNSEKNNSGDLADRVMASLAQMKKDRENQSPFETKGEAKKVDDSIKTPATPKNKLEKVSIPDKKTPSKPISVSNPKKTKVESEKAKSTTSKKAITKKEPLKRVAVKSKTDDKKALDSKVDKKGNQKGQKDTEKPESIRIEHKLIDNFIASDIKIKPIENPSKEDKIEDLSKKSTTFHSHLISENLANIFEKQGKKDKAKVIYEQLQLKYPEKKAYFAAKINNLDS